MSETKKKLVGRHKRVAFMDATGDGKTYTRMTGFTSMSESKNASEYSRHYVDEESERTDVVGYAASKRNDGTSWKHFKRENRNIR